MQRNYFLGFSTSLLMIYILFFTFYDYSPSTLRLFACTPSTCTCISLSYASHLLLTCQFCTSAAIDLQYSNTCNCFVVFCYIRIIFSLSEYHSSWLSFGYSSLVKSNFLVIMQSIIYYFSKSIVCMQFVLLHVIDPFVLPKKGHALVPFIFPWLNFFSSILFWLLHFFFFFEMLDWI